MPTMRLTPRGVAALKATDQQTEYYDDVVPGLALRVGRGGTKVYTIRYRSNGRNRRLKIGRHPHMTLADARSRARAELAKVSAGEDPAEVRREQRSTDATFGALVEEVMAAKTTRNRDRSMRELKRAIDKDVLPAWKDRPAAGITRRDVVQLIDGIVSRGSPVQANRTLVIIKGIFNEGLRRGFPTLEVNPAHMLKATEENGRDRFLERDEVKAVWRAIAFEAPVTRGIFRLALLTAQRAANVRAIRWQDIDGADVWRIPADQFKGRREHWVPLSAEVLAELEQLRELTGDDEHIFPGRGDGKLPHVNSTNAALARIRKRAGIPDWTLHDFRTTFRTHATRDRKPQDKRDPVGLGIAPFVADAVLGHKEASLGFERYTGEASRYLLSEKRAALAAWGKFVAAVARAD